MHASTGIYRHLPVNAFPAYTYRCFSTCYSLFRSIYIYMLFERRSRDLAVLHSPKPLLRVPSASCSLGLRTSGHILDPYAQMNDVIVGIAWLRRQPRRAFDDQFDRLQALPLLGIVPEANASKSSPYFAAKVFVPRWPGFRFSRVFMWRV